MSPHQTLNKEVFGSRTRLTSAAIHSEAVGSWGALVAAAPHDVGFAAALTSHRLTRAADGALRVTLTGCTENRRSGSALNSHRAALGPLTQSAVVNNSRDAADELGAGVIQSRHRRHHEGAQAQVL